MITRTILASATVALAMAVTPATASPATDTAQVTEGKAHSAGFKYFKKHQRVGRHGRFVNQGFRTRHFGHRGFYRGTSLGYYPGIRKEHLKKHNDKHDGKVSDRYGNPLKLFGGGALFSN